MDQNSLYELTAEYGEVYGLALPRVSYLLKTIDNTDNWLNLSEIIGFDRARKLASGDGTPDFFEMKALIAWQADRALKIADTSVTPIIWLCVINDTGDVLAVESWDDNMDVELKFSLIGKFKSIQLAIDHLDNNYIFDISDL